MSVSVVFCVVGWVLGAVLFFLEEGVLGCLSVFRLVSGVVHDCVRPD